MRRVRPYDLSGWVLRVFQPLLNAQVHVFGKLQGFTDGQRMPSDLLKVVENSICSGEQLFSLQPSKKLEKLVIPCQYIPGKILKAAPTAKV